MIDKMYELLRVATRDLTEFRERLTTIIEPRLEGISDHSSVYQPVGEAEMLAIASEALGVCLGDFVRDAGCEAVAKLIQERRAAIGEQGPFLSIYSADLRFARFCYALCRALQPETVIETGVAYGLTSAFVLQALTLNRRGRLVSIDLPPLSKESGSYVGRLVPDELRPRWDLRIGSSERLLPPALQEVGSLDVFIHDSLHTYSNMKREFQTVRPYLSASGVILADDIETNLAFRELVDQPGVRRWAAGKEEQKAGLYGFSYLGEPRSALGKGGAES